MTAPAGLLEILVAALGGAAIGVERQRSGHASGPRARFGGIRTFTLIVGKSRLHALVGRVDDEEMRAAARFGVMAVVILPLLPEGPLGPLGGIRPRALWQLVLFFSGLSFAGYLARRIFGAGRGYLLA